MQGPESYNNIIANTVVIGGANGALFVYSGTPALGNLIASISPLTTTDQFGNNVAAGINSYVPDGVGNFTQSSQMLGGQFNVQNTNGNIDIFGGQINFGAFLFISENAPGTTLTIGAGQAGIANLQVLLPVHGAIGAEQPGTTGTFEGWHDMTLINGWTHSAGGYAKYKLTPFNAVHLIGDGLLPGTTTDNTPIWTAPTGYIPTRNINLDMLMIWSTQPTVVPDVPKLFFRTNGDLCVFTVAPTGSVPSSFGFNAICPLD